jgi:hypothetical protein
LFVGVIALISVICSSNPVICLSQAVLDRVDDY